MYRIMIVEDDDKIADILAGYLRRYGYVGICCSDFDDVKSEFVKLDPDLVLLDINLPYMDGFFWCRQIRTISKVPVIFISARASDMDQVLALEHGGDDYITKPFSIDVVMAKVKAALRRTYGEYALETDTKIDVYEVHGLYLNRSKRSLTWQEEEVFLTPKEFALMDILTRHLGEVVLREQLLEALWDDVDFVDDNTLTVNVTRLRRKLDEMGITGAIETVRGEGYRIQNVWTVGPVG
ncbi:MAG: response regulator transcription factor [Limnochordia bacterium]|jgi:two-component system OmpR family response regulator|nr:response regulator transcription factor [Limnochordia bacterium]MDD2630063.1 response regulator transcription factor [Limnochordia bacterium]MDD4518987.1 response regulator transcription factor [Limnochordia bacterium]